MINYGAPMMKEKAGIEVDSKEKIAHVVEQCTDHSKFRALEIEKMKLLGKKVQKFKKMNSKINENDLKDAESKSDEIYSQVIMKSLSTIYQRNVIFHIDMDAFFAEVEILDEPKYRDVPMAVGGMSMLCTSNYAARKFGIRAAMPGFIAMKLCPHLVIIPPQFPKYKEKSDIIHEILRKYDENMVSAGIDEAYINATAYLKLDSWLDDVTSLIFQIKKEIYDKTKLTCSIGASYSYLLAKICSNVKKPNGHFIMLQESTENSQIKDFVYAQPVSRIKGVGTVTQEYLKSLNVLTCADIYEHRGEIFHMFGERRAIWLFYSSYGLDEDIDEDEENDRKTRDLTIGIERTIKPTHNQDELYKAIDKIIYNLVDMLETNNLLTQRVTLKIKFDDFHNITRCRSLITPTSESQAIKNVVHNLLRTELSIPSNYSRAIRLLGVRVNKIPKVPHTIMNEAELATSLNSVNHTLDEFYDVKKLVNAPSSQLPKVNCPICNRLIVNEENAANKHIDNCLSLEYIKNECK